MSENFRPLLPDDVIAVMRLLSTGSAVKMEHRDILLKLEASGLSRWMGATMDTPAHWVLTEKGRCALSGEPEPLTGDELAMLRAAVDGPGVTVVVRRQSEVMQGLVNRRLIESAGGCTWQATDAGREALRAADAAAPIAVMHGPQTFKITTNGEEVGSLSISDGLTLKVTPGQVLSVQFGAGGHGGAGGSIPGWGSPGVVVASGTAGTCTMTPDATNDGGAPGAVGTVVDSESTLVSEIAAKVETALKPFVGRPNTAKTRSVMVKAVMPHFRVGQIDALLALLQAASGPDATIDAKISATLFAGDGREVDAADPTKLYIPGCGSVNSITFPPLRYTAVIDAALMLRPKGASTIRTVEADENGANVFIGVDAHYCGRAFHASEPIATCIAALQARRAMLAAGVTP